MVKLKSKQNFEFQTFNQLPTNSTVRAMTSWLRISGLIIGREDNSLKGGKFNDIKPNRV